MNGEAIATSDPCSQNRRIQRSPETSDPAGPVCLTRSVNLADFVKDYVLCGQPG